MHIGQVKIEVTNYLKSPDVSFETWKIFECANTYRKLCNFTDKFSRLPRVDLLKLHPELTNVELDRFAKLL